MEKPKVIIDSNNHKNGTMAVEDAKKVLIGENRKRVDACKEELHEVLTRHNCTMRVVPSIEVILK